MIVWDLGSVPVTSQCSNPALCLGKTEERSSPYVGPVCEVQSHIALK